jgi:hypothetical protein
VSALKIRRLTASDAADYRAIRLAALKSAPEAFGSTYAGGYADEVLMVCFLAKG